jgi:hypothetical protein
MISKQQQQQQRQQEEDNYLDNYNDGDDDEYYDDYYDDDYYYHDNDSSINVNGMDYNNKKRYDNNIVMTLKSLSVDSPGAIFKSLEQVRNIITTARKKQKRFEALQRMPRGRIDNGPVYNNGNDNDNNNQSSTLVNRYARSASRQMHNFDQLHKVSKKYTKTWCCSWKNRHYNERIIYLVDISRTIWIIAICPFHPLLLMFVGLVVIVLLGYYIRIDMGELNDTATAIDRMDETHTSRDK